MDDRRTMRERMLAGDLYIADDPVTPYESAPRDHHTERLRYAIGASDIELSTRQVIAARRAYYASVSDVDS
ncbi:MAG: hypothetical protein OEX04_05415 [Acidimicrobiia bacterium]|nr:hypothetical protein [Acidimicrobiia bacterium]MDH4306897.1 hypothetical protein [Acidimicrobiia bacterium]MDH5292727.1 hypothetical protein [Acidimicrobiia bacterium]